MGSASRPGVSGHRDADEGPGSLRSRAGVGPAAKGGAPQPPQERRVRGAAVVLQAGSSRLRRRLGEAVNEPLVTTRTRGGAPLTPPRVDRPSPTAPLRRVYKGKI